MLERGREARSERTRRWSWKLYETGECQIERERETEEREKGDFREILAGSVG